MYLGQRSSSVVLVAENGILQPNNSSAQTLFERQLVRRRQGLHRHAAGSVTLPAAAMRLCVCLAMQDLRDAILLVTNRSTSYGRTGQLLVRDSMSRNDPAGSGRKRARAS